ncbi:helix-turn-helix domain-containing protein [Micromonospora siamensis]|uniref:Helix-turn-helix n=1 Tax=Micromonospora siamensis TaxID=299152 RepID=A0A1C5H910_9ACTN|nr:transcriptional regulator [Micromonospora siamensis]SCG42494.1 Helix-turn-helix [Micromonospora siamensis]
MSLLRRVIGGVLRRIRLRQRRTLREVAEVAGVSLPYLSEVERGRKEASSEVLAAICRALGISLSDLLEEARNDLRRVEPRIPAAPRAGLAGATSVGPRAVPAGRLPVAGQDAAGQPVRIGFHPAGARSHLAAPAPHPTGTMPHVVAALPRLGTPFGVGSPAGLGAPLGDGSAGRLGSPVGGAGLRVWLTASAPGGRTGPRTSAMLARRRARARRRRLTAA